jgi:7-cyano-7-deazaguanine synthase
MSLVILVSGGLDSTLISVLAKEEGIQTYPLFIDYGQLCLEREWEACVNMHTKLKLSEPVKMNLSGFGSLIPSGLTKRELNVNEDAFLPGRNLLFILAGCAYAYSKNSGAVAIGLLSEETHLFPDQTKAFIDSTMAAIYLAMDRNIKIVTPLMNLHKPDVIALAKKKGIEGTYSCHAGTIPRCGVCVACKQYLK